MSTMIPRRLMAPCVALLMGLSVAAQAAPVDQAITLKGGWNAVYLEVEPANAEDPAQVFLNVPDVESVWAWNPRTSTVEFVTDPGGLQAPMTPTCSPGFREMPP